MEGTERMGVLSLALDRCGVALIVVGMYRARTRTGATWRCASRTRTSPATRRGAAAAPESQGGRLDRDGRAPPAERRSVPRSPIAGVVLIVARVHRPVTGSGMTFDTGPELVIPLIIIGILVLLIVVLVLWSCSRSTPRAGCRRSPGCGARARASPRLRTRGPSRGAPGEGRDLADEFDTGDARARVRGTAAPRVGGWGCWRTGPRPRVAEVASWQGRRRSSTRDRDRRSSDDVAPGPIRASRAPRGAI